MAGKRKAIASSIFLLATLATAWSGSRCSRDKSAAAMRLRENVFRFDDFVDWFRRKGVHGCTCPDRASPSSCSLIASTSAF
jgi:hypothetical protein